MQKVRLKGDEIRKILALKNKSQNWFAQRINVSSGHMAQLLKGDKNPSPELRDRIQHFFPERTFEDLFQFVE